MRKLLIALALMPLAACGVAQTAVDAAQEKRQDAEAEAEGTTTVILPVPKAETPAATKELTEEDRFRKEFGDPERFTEVHVENGNDVYVLDRTTGCVYHQDLQRGRDAVLGDGGRADCTYRQR